jgi:site-specific DNA recombinase
MAALIEPATTTRTSRPRYVAPVLPHKAAVYTRVSTKRQGDDVKTSLETQETGCRYLASTDGYPIDASHIWVDKHTGEELHERPALTALREAAKRREFSRLYVHSTDRLSRDPIHLGIVLEEMERAGISVVFVTEPLDDSPEAGLIRYVHGYHGKLENAKRRERTMRAVHERARRQQYLPSNRPLYGYDFGPERETRPDGTVRLLKIRLVPNSDQQPVVQQVYRWAADGYSLRRIADELNHQAVPTSKGRVGGWSYTTVRNLLTLPAYWGQATALRTQQVPVPKDVRHLYCDKVRQVTRAPSEQILLPPETVPALVSPELARAAQRRLRETHIQPVRTSTRWKMKAEHEERNIREERGLVCGGIARCGLCQHAMELNTMPPCKGSPRARTRYFCSYGAAVGRVRCRPHAIEGRKLDTLIWAKVAEILRRPELIEQEVARRRSGGPSLDTQTLAELDAQIARDRRQITNLSRSLGMIDDVPTQRQLAEDINKLAAVVHDREAERAVVAARVARECDEVDGLENLLATVKRFGQDVDGFTFAQRRQALLALEAVAYVYPSDHQPRIRLRVRLPLTGDLAERLGVQGLEAQTAQLTDQGSHSVHRPTPTG